MAPEPEVPKATSGTSTKNAARAAQRRAKRAAERKAEAEDAATVGGKGREGRGVDDAAGALANLNVGGEGGGGVDAGPGTVDTAKKARSQCLWC